MKGEEIVERVAGRLYGHLISHGWREDYDYASAQIPYRGLEAATKAVILATLEAIREPSEAVIDAADVPMFSDFYGPVLTWQKMIDALKREIEG